MGERAYAEQSTDSTFPGPDDEEQRPARRPRPYPRSDREPLTPSPSRSERFAEIFYPFFDRLFSAEGRSFRRFMSFCIAVIFALWWWGDDLLRAGVVRSVQSWLVIGDRRWYVIGVVAIATLLIFYGARRRRQARRGIHSPPWLLILAVGMAALAVSLSGGFLLYRFAPDEAAKFDAVKTAITMFAGAAGVGALVLSLRSHFTSESDRLSRQFDQAADRLTEDSLILQAAALVSLQRLGRKHRAYRHSVVEVVSAYCDTQRSESETPPHGSSATSPSCQTLALEILHEMDRG